MTGDDIHNFYKSIKKVDGVFLLDPLCLGNLVEKKGEQLSSSIERLVNKKLNKNNLVFMPANQKSLHWSLIVYEKSIKTFHHYDSLGGLNFSLYSPLCEKILRNVAATSSFVKKEKTPQQCNGNDCEVYVMAITQFLVNRYKRNTSKMNWEISDDEAQEIHKSVREIRKKLSG